MEGSTRTIEGVNRDIHVKTEGFLKIALKAISGQEKIPIIYNIFRWAEIIVLSAYKIEDNKTYNDTLDRSRQIACI